MRTVITVILLPLLATLLFACAPAPRRPEMLDPGFASRNIVAVALAPVIFKDEPIDRYHGTRVAAEILGQARQRLLAKGYQVTRTGEETALFPFGGTEPPPFPFPDAADALLTIRIDHFLDAGLYDRESRNSLDVYATATLSARDGEILWRDQGVGRGIRASVTPDPIQDFTVAASLVDSLFDTLPAR